MRGGVGGETVTLWMTLHALSESSEMKLLAILRRSYDKACPELAWGCSTFRLISQDNTSIQNADQIEALNSSIYHHDEGFDVNGHAQCVEVEQQTAACRNLKASKLERLDLLRPIFKPFVQMVNKLASYEAIIFPADGHAPHLIELSASPVLYTNPLTGQLIVTSVLPHPEVFMDNIADNRGRAWKWQLAESLDGMTTNFAEPYVIFYPVISRNGDPFPVNKSIREIKGSNFNEAMAWRGNIIIAKYRSGGSNPFLSMIHIRMADFPLLRNYFLTRNIELESE